MRKKILFYKFLSALLTTGLIIGCGSSGNSTGNSIPVWVDNPANSFSQDKYLMAVGSGSTLNEARSDAFANLSQIFQMNVDATEELNTEMIDRSVDNEMFSESTSQLLNNIRIGTNQELMNTSILASETDNFGTYYALAGMDKAESARIYKQEIANNNIKIEEFENTADNEENILQKLVLLTKAKTVANANEVLTQQLNIILGGSGTGSDATQTLTRIQEKFRAAQQKANVIITTDNATETVKSAIAGVLQKAGFNISEEQKNAVLSVKVNFQTQNADLNRDDAEFAKWELVIDITDLQSNRSFRTFMAEGRDGAPSYADALKRADYSARMKIEKDFNTFLNNELLVTY